MLPVLLPAICWVYLYKVLNRRGHDWRSAFLVSSVLCGTFLTLTTEILSMFRSLTLPWLAVFWGILAMLAIFSYYAISDRSPKHDETFPPFLKLLVSSVVTIVIATGFIAMIAPPNSWDSMTYHMGRVTHWIQNRSVEHFPTNIVRQLESPPWAEYAIMHLQILSGRDNFANLVQWFCMIGSIIGVTLIAKQLGADLREQILSSVIAATIPMGILQATSTQNDYVVTFWLVCFVHFGNLTKQRSTWYHAIAAGASLGLALLTKGTAYLYAFPFCLWFSFAGIKAHRWKIITPILAMLTITLLLNIGHYKRNIDLFRNPLISGTIALSNEIYSLPVFLSNTVRNLSLHFGTFSGSINRKMTTAITSLHKAAGMNVNDEKTTFGGEQFRIERIRVHEDTAGNPVHILLIAVCVLLLLFWSKERGLVPALLPYISAVSAGFVIFCFVLKWQPWSSRLQLPLFILWSPVIGMVLSRQDRGKYVNAIVILLLLASIPYIIKNESRPLISNRHQLSIMKSDRLDQYFYNYPELKGSYYASVRQALDHECNSIGLQLGSDDWEYPIWIIAQEIKNKLPRIEHVQVNNVSAKIPLTQFTPCSVLRSDADKRLFVVSR
jgi:4-amino-4-deoxy-L-arabinose transferase-like glycosyltransferase